MTSPFSEATRRRIAKWSMEAKPVSQQPVWTEMRRAIVFGGHTYIVSNGQVFQCGHCGHYDPEWSATEVMPGLNLSMTLSLLKLK
jgi:hypothetical protein